MTPTQFEAILDETAEILTENLRSSPSYHGPEQFERGVLDMLRVVARGFDVTVEPTRSLAFPDIRVNGFGVEVKYSRRDTWNAVGNSVFEGTRDDKVEVIYVMFGKVGGTPEVRWGKYEDRVKHVLVSNSPRFVLDMSETESSLFERIGIDYSAFATLEKDGKMAYIRDYWRGRLQPGEHIWWLEENHTRPLNVRLYTHLSQYEKRTLLAEAALLCPQICKPSRAKQKYKDVAVYLLTYHDVLCLQVRDLFSAGSVAMRADKTRGGNYTLRALKDIESLMLDSAERLEDALFVEYWGESCPPEKRIERWLELADSYAKGWKPSSELFQKGSVGKDRD